MPRSSTLVRGRLEAAAIALYAERGFTGTTAAAIAAEAGVTGRTFFRHFSDKREVVFAADADIDRALADAVRGAGRDDAAWTTVRAAVHAVGAVLQDQRDLLRVRASVIAAEPALRERELSKRQQLADTLRAALLARGAGALEAAVLSAVALALFGVAFAAWLAADDRRTLADHLDAALALVGAAAS